MKAGLNIKEEKEINCPGQRLFEDSEKDPNHEDRKIY